MGNNVGLGDGMSVGKMGAFVGLGVGIEDGV